MDANVKKLRGDATRRASQESGTRKGKSGRVMILCRSVGYSKQSYYRIQHLGSRLECECYL